MISLAAAYGAYYYAAIFALAGRVGFNTLNGLNLGVNYTALIGVHRLESTTAACSEYLTGYATSEAL
jgi:hypothetical protein